MLYITAITSTPVLYTIENLPLYESDTIFQKLDHLLLDTFYFHLHYLQVTTATDQALLLLNRDLSQHMLNALHLHGFHTYLEHLQPKVLLLVFLPIYQSLSLTDQDHYQTIATSIPDKPQIEVALTPLPVPPLTLHSPPQLSS